MTTDPDSFFEVALRFRPDGPVSLGAWADDKTAREKFIVWIGLYARPGVQITLTEHRADGSTELLDA
jgi:hypothetical protein